MTTSQDKPAEFESAVIASFEFLELNHGFLCRVSRPQEYTHLVIYESPDLYVILSYGPPAYEPEMSFGRRGIDDGLDAYSFHPADLLKLDCCSNWSWGQAQGNLISRWVGELARLMATCGARFLANDPSIFAQMKSRRDQLASDWKRDEKSNVVRAQIDSAWKAKDYQQVLKLYESIDDLTDLDKKRVAFAKAQV